ncbi:hypothetical protein GCM10009557_06300 [Virgisporangium ochraceum]
MAERAGSHGNAPRNHELPDGGVGARTLTYADYLRTTAPGEAPAGPGHHRGRSEIGVVADRRQRVTSDSLDLAALLFGQVAQHDHVADRDEVPPVSRSLLIMSDGHGKGRSVAPPKKYPDDLKARAVWLYRESDPKPTIRKLAEQLNVHHEALRNWIRQDQADRGERADQPTTEMVEENRRLRKEVAELRRANEILKAASAYFASELCTTWR